MIRLGVEIAFEALRLRVEQGDVGRVARGRFEVLEPAESRGGQVGEGFLLRQALGDRDRMENDPAFDEGREDVQDAPARRELVLSRLDVPRSIKKIVGEDERRAPADDAAFPEIGGDRDDALSLQDLEDDRSAGRPPFRPGFESQPDPAGQEEDLGADESRP